MFKKRIKYSKLLVFAFMLLLFSSIYVIADHRVQTIVRTGNYMIHDTEQALFDASELVVVARPTGRSRTVLEGDDPDRNGYTLTEIDVLAVLKSSARVDIRPHDRIHITEPYYVIDMGFKPGKQKVTVEDYTELQAGARYVLYLVWDPRSNTFGVYTGPQGKFNLDGLDWEEDKVRNDHIRSMKAAVKAKYADHAKIQSDSSEK